MFALKRRICGGLAMHKNKKNISKEYLYIILIFICLFVSSCNQKKPETYDTKVLVLNDCDNDNNPETIPPGDSLLMLDANGEIVNKIEGLQIKKAANNASVICVSEDSQYFAVCENAANKVTIFETSTGKEYRSAKWLDKSFSSVEYANNLLYAYNSSCILPMDINDMNDEDADEYWFTYLSNTKFDKADNSIWVTGIDIRRFDYKFNLLAKIESIDNLSMRNIVSIDIDSQGFCWIAFSNQEENYSNLVKLSPQGDIIKNIQLDAAVDFIIIDKSDNNVWITSITSNKDYSLIGDEWPDTINELHDTIQTNLITYTYKYDSNGTEILKINKGGYSLDIDPSDSSIWIAGYDNIIHCSSDGGIIKEVPDTFGEKKWIAIVK